VSRGGGCRAGGGARPPFADPTAHARRHGSLFVGALVVGCVGAGVDSGLANAHRRYFGPCLASEPRRSDSRVNQSADGATTAVR
jgi:hypothetical protein